MKISNDLEGMQLALEWAAKGLYTTAPNPHIGCVIVRDGEVIGQGVTQKAGSDHAEIQALKDAAARGHDVHGATAYVTLEPCGQRSGGTPSCGQKLAAAGVSRVVYACADPSPYASHKGPSYLADAGIVVEPGLCADAASVLIEGFVHWLNTGLPLLSDDKTIPYDAEFVRDETVALEDDLRAWGARGYRRLLQGSQS